MKKIEIVMGQGVIEARFDDGDVLRQGKDTAFLGRLEINSEAHSNLMPADQIKGFLTYLKFHFYPILNYPIHFGPFQNYLLTFLSHFSPLLAPSPPSTLNSGHA